MEYSKKTGHLWITTIVIIIIIIIFYIIITVMVKLSIIGYIK